MAQPFNSTALARAMERATDEVKDEVDLYFAEAAVGLRSRLRETYHRRTGNLQDRISVTAGRSAPGAPKLRSRLVRASSPHVHIYQKGTRQRHDATRGGANRGKSPAHGPIFQAAAAQSRREALAKAEALLGRPKEL